MRSFDLLMKNSSFYIPMPGKSSDTSDTPRLTAGTGPSPARTRTHSCPAVAPINPGTVQLAPGLSAGTTN